MMRLVRALQLGGFVLIAACIVTMIVVPAVRPRVDWGALIAPALLIIGAGVVTGIVLRRRIGLEQRLQLLRQLDPRSPNRELGHKVEQQGKGQDGDG